MVAASASASACAALRRGVCPPKVDVRVLNRLFLVFLVWCGRGNQGSGLRMQWGQKTPRVVACPEGAVGAWTPYESTVGPLSSPPHPLPALQLHVVLCESMSHPHCLPFCIVLHLWRGRARGGYSQGACRYCLFSTMVSMPPPPPYACGVTGLLLPSPSPHCSCPPVPPLIFRRFSAVSGVCIIFLFQPLCASSQICEFLETPAIVTSLGIICKVLPTQVFAREVVKGAWVGAWVVAWEMPRNGGALTRRNATNKVGPVDTWYGCREWTGAEQWCERCG